MRPRIVPFPFSGDCPSAVIRNLAVKVSLGRMKIDEELGSRMSFQIFDKHLFDGPLPWVREETAKDYHDSLCLSVLWTPKDVFQESSV